MLHIKVINLHIIENYLLILHDIIMFVSYTGKYFSFCKKKPMNAKWLLIICQL